MKLTTRRMPKESTPAYDAWLEYRDMGAERTQEAVAKKLSKSRQLIGRWSMRFRWTERIALWDNENAERENAAATNAAQTTADEREALRRDIQRRAADGFRKLWDKAEVILSMPLLRHVRQRHPVSLLTKKARAQYPEGLEAQVIEPLNCRPSDAAKYIELADQLGRLAAGMPSKVTAITDPEGKPFTIPQSATPQTLIVNVTRDGNRDAVVREFGERPDQRERTTPADAG